MKPNKRLSLVDSTKLVQLLFEQINRELKEQGGAEDTFDKLFAYWDGKLPNDVISAVREFVYTLTNANESAYRSAFWKTLKERLSGNKARRRIIEMLRYEDHPALPEVVAALSHYRRPITVDLSKSAEGLVRNNPPSHIYSDIEAFDKMKLLVHENRKYSVWVELYLFPEESETRLKSKIRLEVALQMIDAAGFRAATLPELLCYFAQAPDVHSNVLALGTTWKQNGVTAAGYITYVGGELDEWIIEAKSTDEGLQYNSLLVVRK
jgi:hypothetical protein